MKELYNKYFRIPKHGKLSEKVFLARITLSITLIVVCLAAMSYSAYAYFSCTVTSGVNIIRSAVYKLDIIPEIAELQPVGGIYILDNTAGTDTAEYKFKIVKSKEATADVGYCEIEIQTDDGRHQTLYTEPIGTFKAGGEKHTDEEFTLILKVDKGVKAMVSFTAQWGSCAGVLIPDGTVVELTAPVSSEETQQAVEDEAQNTEQSETQSSEEASSEEQSSITEETSSDTESSETVSSDEETVVRQDSNLP